MNRFLSLPICLTVVSLVLTTATVFLPASWIADAGLDFWALPWLQGDLEKEQLRAEELAVISTRIFRRLEAKQAVVAELVEGQLSLKEAIARFRVLFEDDPTAVEGLRQAWPAATMDESLCRHVLASAISHAEVKCPERVAALRNSLEEQARPLLSER